ncbi:MAG: 30S ribosomal protein S18 [Candidatus Saccharibacteria bacterium]|nr:30S ribosomal protein S18 [Candidatus Saccharibacteria bacterium]
MHRYKNDTKQYFDYMDTKTLQRYTDIYGRIEPMTKTGLSAKQQRQLKVAIKRARHLALMPFVASN